MNKQMILALAAGTTAFAGVVGSAATLGGITSDNLGADTAVVASCHTSSDPDIEVDYTTALDEASGDYLVTDVTLTGINAACANQAISVALLDADSELTEITDTVDAPVSPATASTMAFEVTDTVVAEDVTRASVVISG